MIRIAANPHGPRLYVLGLRVHHGPLGAAACAGLYLARRKRLALIAAAWAASDYKDFPFTDKCNH